MILKTIRYLKAHGLRKTLARSFLELSRRLDSEVDRPVTDYNTTAVTLESQATDIPYTGERVVPAYKNDCFYAHLSIYNFVKDFIENNMPRQSSPKMSTPPASGEPPSFIGLRLTPHRGDKQRPLLKKD